MNLSGTWRIGVVTAAITLAADRSGVNTLDGFTAAVDAETGRR